MAKTGLFSTMAIAVLAGFIGASPARAEAEPACSAPGSLMRLDHAIAHTAVRVAEYPDMQIEVINRGVGGEDAREMLARLDKSVLAERPDLVLWQVGTNAIVDEEGVSEEGALVRKGLARLKAARVDVILIDPQYSPTVIRRPHAGAMVRMLKTVAQAANVAVFRRFAIMSHWHTVEHVPFERFTVKDGLHMNDWGYRCIASLLANSIVAAVSRPVPVAGGAPVQQARL
jgi:lysophospholipase L1-like esterase